MKCKHFEKLKLRSILISVITGMETEFGLGENFFSLVPGHKQAVWLDVTLDILYFLCICLLFYVAHMFLFVFLCWSSVPS